MAVWFRGKTRRRIGTILLNSLHSLLQPVLNIAVSFIVVRRADEALWGAFVAVLIVVQLLLHVIAWGNKDYLLRAFSRTPAKIRTLWQTNISTRAVFLLLTLPLLTLFYDQLAGALLLWVVAAFIASSFDVLVIYQRRFLIALFVEALATGFVVFALVTADALTVPYILWAFALGATLKAALWLLIFRHMLKGLRPRFEARYFDHAATFFLLGFSGMLGSRIDLYTVSALLDEQSTGRYQIFINLMLYLQAMAQFIMLPFVKSVYRLDDGAIQHMMMLLFRGGVFIIPFALVAAHRLFIWVYDIHYDLMFMLLGGLFVLPIYAYLPLIYRLYKRNEQGAVLRKNLIGAGANLGLNLLLLPVWGLHGALFSSALMQWTTLIYYLWRWRKSDASGLPTLQPGD
jgi:O-antigen/teichoic acid export membrane protein